MNELHTSGRPVAGSVDDLVAGATRREPLDHTDGKSGARLERVEIDGETFVLKFLDLADDWTLRAVGDLSCNVLQMWERGLFDRLPDCIDQPIVAVARARSRDGLHEGAALLMRDIGRWMVPPGDTVVPLAQHLGFIDHMAALHATFWEAGPEIELVPISNRYLALSPWLAATEAALGTDALIPQLVARGWALLPEVAPRAAEIVLPIANDVSPLVDALAPTPTTFVHGNWKYGNLGTHDDGRTVIIDWEDPGRGHPCAELAWYLALNSARLPHSKEAAIDAYRAALERHGIDTAPWWDLQMAVALLAGLVWFGWEKALGGAGDELEWWEARAVAAAPLLAR